MILMAIDHIRDFFHAGAMHFSPEDLTQTSVPLFFTRWITHFCAPVFIFLAGTSAYLSIGRKQSRSAVSYFLCTRGLWLVVVEMTLIEVAAMGNFSFNPIIWQVIWAIGWSMVALSVLMFVPWATLLCLSVATIALHNAFDRVPPEQLGSLGWLWKILHVGFATIAISPQHTALVVYPLIPWIAVMSAGYCFGRVMELDPVRRRRFLFQLGGAVTAGFIVLRMLNGYGDPSPWTPQPRAMMTLVSFLRTTKYPPSLAYLMMTLGPSFMVLGALEGVTVGTANPFLVFGRVPMFYYIIHWYTLHAVAIGFAWVRYGRVAFLFSPPPSLLPNPSYPPDYGYPLWVVYAVWISIVCGLYFPCRWFAGIKARHQRAWLSYL